MKKFKLLLVSLVLMAFGATGVYAEDYAATHTSNVTFTLGNKSYKEKMNIAGTSYDVVKLGTSSVVGTASFKIPAGTAKIHMHVIGWKGKSSQVNLTANNGVTLGTTAITPKSDDGATSNSPYTLKGDATTYYYEITTTGVEQETTITMTTVSGKTRVIVWGVNTEVATVVDPETPEYTITANVNDPAMGIVSGAGKYYEGTVASLNAIPNSGYQFVNWSNGSTDNPLKITVTEDVEVTANFEAIPPMTCAEAAATANGATVVLNPFDVVAVVKGAGYIYIKDESGVNLIYDFNLDDQLKAGDHVEGFVGVSSPYYGLPELKPSVAFADLTVTPGTAPEPTLFTEVPTKADLNKYVKFENVTLTANATFTTSSASNATMVVNGKNVTLRNNFKLAATLSKDKAYNIVGFAAIYNSTIQVYFLSAEEYVAPAPCTFATPVKWTETISLEANADKWYLVDIAEAVAAEKDLTLTISNTSEEDVEVTIDSYSTCPADELDRILASTKTIKAGETLEKDVNFVKYLQGLVDQVYLHVTTVGGAIEVKAETAKFNVTATAENGTVEGAGIYEQGAEATLTATPAEGYEFVNWTSGETVVSTENPYKFTVTSDVALVANFQEVAEDPNKVPTNAELWEAFKPYYKTFYSEERADQPITMVATFMTKGEKILTDPTSEYKWLGDYLVKIATEQGFTINSEALWRWHADAFFQANQHTAWPKSADFTEAGKPENWGPYYLAAKNGTTPEPVMETVYFVNAQNWTGTINAYAWDPVQNANWPGVAATKEAEQIGGYDVYSYTAEAGTYKNIIFNGTGGQTADLVWTAGKYYVKDGWYTKEEAEAQLAKPVEYESVYFVNAQGWSKVNIYTWTPEVGGWPGVAMTKEAEQLAGYDVYSYTVEKGTSFGGMLFNNTTGAQTGDLKWTAGKYYVKDGWYTKEEAEAKLAAPVVVTWTMVGQEELFTPAWTPTAVENDMEKQEDGSYVLVLENKTLEAGTYEYKAVKDHDWAVSIPQEGNYTLEIAKDGDYTIEFTVNAAATELTAKVTYIEPKIEWIPMDLEIANLTTEVMEVEGAKYLLLQGRDDMNDADVMLFLNNYADVDDDYEVNTESSYMTFGGMELTVLEGVMTQTSETDKGTIYTGTVRASVEEEGETMYVEFALTMYAAPATVLVLTDAIVAINEELGTLTFNVPTGEGEGYYAELAGYTAPGVHEGPQICLFETPEAVAFANYVETSVADGVITLKGEFTSFMGAKFDVTISGKLPVVEPEVVEPTYTENNLNTYAFGLESVLNDEALVVTYRLNNSNADAVEVVVLNGEKVVATVPGTTAIGKNTVEIPVAELPQGVQLTWKVVVKGTSVEVPTQEAKMYNMYCPHGLAIDKDPESEYFGRILVADAMNIVKDKAGYLGSGIGAGLHAFNPSFTTDSTVYTGGNDFTRILASNGYQPWRVKISEDGRIFVSSLDLNGVVVWEVSKDLQTWTPVIAGTNDATDHNIYDADGNFVAGLNCSMDVIGSGEDLKLLLYSTNNKGIAFNQSGYRLDEYALGTATTWTGTPKNILEGGKLGVVHTNVEFIYDGEGGYWFGGSRAGNAGQPNLVHINAAGEQDYYTEDASLYGGDGVLVHNGMLFKGKARTSGTVGNFGVWTIGKDADGKVTLTEKWSVVADGIGRNLNEFAVDYAENLYVVGNSGEKIIAYALPYDGEVETPAAAKYAFQIGEPVEPVEMVGTVKRAVQNDDEVIVLTHEADGTAHIYRVADGIAIAELSQEGVIAVDPENAGDYLAISDIAVTEDGKLVATNYMQTQSGDDYVDAGYKRGETRIYIWNDLAGDPAILFTSKMSSNWFRSKQGLTMAVKGTSDNMEIFMTGIHATKAWARASSYRVIDGVYVEPEVNHNDHYFFYDINDAIALETTVGTQYELNASPLGAMNWILDANLINPTEIVESETNNVEIATSVALSEDLGKKYNGASYVTVGEQVLMVAPFATPEGKLTSVQILDITAGLDAPKYVDQLFIDEAVEATAAATAVEIVEGDEVNALLITLVADATIYSLEATLAKGDNWEVYEDEITNLVIDLDNLVLIGGPSSAFQVDVYLPLGEYNMSEDSYQLTSESSIAVMGSDATFIEGYAYEIDAFAPSAKAVVRCEWNGMKLEFHLTMTATPMEPTVVVVENAQVEIEKYQIFGDMYDYSLKMTGNWLNEADGLTYPVLVEVPVYYPEATEPSEIMSTVTVGGMGDNDPWLGFGEGTLTVTTVDNVVTATGIVQNPMAGVAIDITISGTITNVPDGVENITVTAKPVKMIQNGQLIIKKGDIQYNANGAVVK